MAGGGCGTHNRYTAGCPGCQRVTVAYDRRRRAMLKAGTWQRPVPVEEVEKHVRKLIDAGMGHRRIASASGVSPNTVYIIANRLRPTVHGPTAAALFAVSPVPALPAGMTSTCGTTRRIRALVAIGYTLTDIARCLDRHLQQVWEWAWARQPTITVDNARAVTALFERLSATPGTSVRARNDAGRRGWLPPLAWDNIDDPDSEPNLGADSGLVVDALAIERVLGGHHATLTRLERHYAVHEGRARDMSYTAIAALLRISVSRAKELGARPLPEDCEVAA